MSHPVTPQSCARKEAKARPNRVVRAPCWPSAHRSDRNGVGRASIRRSTPPNNAHARGSGTSRDWRLWQNRNCERESCGKSDAPIWRIPLDAPWHDGRPGVWPGLLPMEQGSHSGRPGAPNYPVRESSSVRRRRRRHGTTEDELVAAPGATSWMRVCSSSALAAGVAPFQELELHRPEPVHLRRGEDHPVEPNAARTLGVPAQTSRACCSAPSTVHRCPQSFRHDSSVSRGRPPGSSEQRRRALAGPPRIRWPGSNPTLISESGAPHRRRRRVAPSVVLWGADVGRRVLWGGAPDHWLRADAGRGADRLLGGW